MSPVPQCRAPVPQLPSWGGMAKPERLLDHRGAWLLAAGVCPSSSVGHLSWFFFPCFVSLAVNPLGQGPRGNPCSHCHGIALCSVEEGPRASPNPVGNQSSCLFRGRPPKYRKIQQEDFQSKCRPLPRCHPRGKARGAGVVAVGGRSPLARSLRPHAGQHQREACG